MKIYTWLDDEGKETESITMKELLKKSQELSELLITKCKEKENEINFISNLFSN